jgi:phage terminase large subunit
LQTVEDTGAISLDNIEREKQAGMPASMVSQEFYCSFSSGVAGAFYGSYLDKAQEEGRIGNVAWEPASSVDTSWDLGFGDSTAIWFYQRVRKELRIIDYLEASGVGLEWYAKELDRKPYSYGSHTLPHDAAVRELGSGRSRVEALRGLGIGIAAVRSILNRCWFDESKCAQGLKALRSYRTEWMLARDQAFCAAMEANPDCLPKSRSPDRSRRTPELPWVHCFGVSLPVVGFRRSG